MSLLRNQTLCGFPSIEAVMFPAAFGGFLAREDDEVDWPSGPPPLSAATVLLPVTTGGSSLALDSSGDSSTTPAAPLLPLSDIQRLVGRALKSI
jgi:hypothetical protein